MRRSLTLFSYCLGGVLLGSAMPPPVADGDEAEARPFFAVEPVEPQQASAAIEAQAAPVEIAPELAPAPAPAPPPPPTPRPPREAMQRGVVIFVSLPSQRLFVFRDGIPWRSTRVSTGRRGHETPAGTFPILQKEVDHRSTLYDDAPMPYMQRLTWSGVALHAGHVPGYPASHGCIRMPREFARELFAITGFSTTTVVVSGQRAASAQKARTLLAGRLS